MGHRVNFGFRIAKLGTRPKGGSPKDNCEFEKACNRGKRKGIVLWERLSSRDITTLTVSTIYRSPLTAYEPK